MTSGSGLLEKLREALVPLGLTIRCGLNLADEGPVLKNGAAARGVIVIGY